MEYKFGFVIAKNDDEYLNYVKEGYAAIHYRVTPEAFYRLENLKDTDEAYLAEYASYLLFHAKEENLINRAIYICTQLKDNSRMNLESGLFFMATGDLKKGLDLINKSIAKGNAIAENVLGSYYIEGQYVEKNEEKGFDLILASADHGFAYAQNQIGSILIRREDERQRGIEYLLKAAYQNLPEALVNIGLCYLQGFGVDADLNKAVDYLEKAANEGFTHAYNILADIFMDGKFAPNDLMRAKEYNKKAYDLGDQYAKTVYQTLCKI